MIHFYLPVTQVSQLSASLGKSASPLGLHPGDPRLPGPAPGLGQPPGLVPCAPVLPPPLPAAPLPAAPGGEDVQSRLGACPYPVAVCREPLWLQGSPFPAAGT